MNAVAKEFTKGLWKEISPFRLVLGLCPVLAVTTSAENGLGMGLAATNILFRLTPHIPVMSKVAGVFIGCTVLIGLSMMIFSVSAAIPGNWALPIAMAYGAFWLTIITIGTQWAVTRMEAGRSAIIIVMELVVAVVSAALLTAAELKAAEITGGLMVLVAAIIEGSRSEEPAFSAAAID